MANKPRMSYPQIIKRIKCAARDKNVSDYLWNTLQLMVVHLEENPEILNDLKISDMLSVARLVKDIQDIEEKKTDNQKHDAFSQRLKELQEKKKLVSQRQTDKQTTRHADRQIDRQTVRQKEKNIRQ